MTYCKVCTGMIFLLCMSAYSFVNHHLCEGFITERAKKWSVSSIGSRVYWHLVFIGMCLFTETTFIWYFRCMCDRVFCKITILMKDLSHRLHVDAFSPLCITISICKSLFTVNYFSENNGNIAPLLYVSSCVY